MTVSRTVNRFGYILSHLHLNDQSSEAKKGDLNYDKLYKLRPYLDEHGRSKVVEGQENTNLLMRSTQSLSNSKAVAE